VQPSEPSSIHPVDQLIVRLVHDPATAATSADIAAIVARMAIAPFSRHLLRAPARDRGLTYGGIVIGRRTDSLDYHLVKRVRDEFQWSEGTTATDYLLDLHAGVQDPRARVLVFARPGDIVAATISATSTAVPLARRGTEWHENLLVVYSALHGVLKTGYMFSGIDKLDLPEDIRWLK